MMPNPALAFAKPNRSIGLSFKKEVISISLRRSEEAGSSHPVHHSAKSGGNRVFGGIKKIDIILFN